MLETAETTKPPSPLTKVERLKLFISNSESALYDCAGIQFTETFYTLELLEVFDFISKFTEKHKNQENLKPTCEVLKVFQLLLSQNPFAITNLIIPVLKDYFLKVESSSIDSKITYVLKEKFDITISSNVNRKELNDKIKKAYHQFASTNHPDKGGNEETFKSGLAAYEAWKEDFEKWEITKRKKEFLKQDKHSTNKFNNAKEYFSKAIEAQKAKIENIHHGILANTFSAEIRQSREEQMQKHVMLVDGSIAELTGILNTLDDINFSTLQSRYRSILILNAIKEHLRFSLVYLRVGLCVKQLYGVPSMALLITTCWVVPHIAAYLSHKGDKETKHTWRDIIYDSGIDNDISVPFSAGLAVINACVLISVCYLSSSAAERRILGISPIFKCSPIPYEFALMCAYSLYTAYRHGHKAIDLPYFYQQGTDRKCIVEAQKLIEHIDYFPWLRRFQNPAKVTGPIAQIMQVVCTIGCISSAVLESTSTEQRIKFLKTIANNPIPVGIVTALYFAEPYLRGLIVPGKYELSYDKTADEIRKAVNITLPIIGLGCLLYTMRTDDSFLSANMGLGLAYLRNHPVLSSLTVLSVTTLYFCAPHLPKAIPSLSKETVDEISEVIRGMRDVFTPCFILPWLVSLPYTSYTIMRNNAGLFNPSALPLSMKFYGIGIVASAILIAGTHLTSKDDKRSLGDTIKAMYR